MKSSGVSGEEPARRWEVVFDDVFRATEWKAMDVEQRKALLAAALALETVGPSGGRPLVGTLNNPAHPNMKELRYDAHSGSEVWRAAFAFDPSRRAIVLVAGAKQGQDEVGFYKELLRKANKRFDAHLVRLDAPRPARGEAASPRKKRRS
ncbi:MAG: type II toxin-antitoxin system RelE/ParE family toxin [Proteobacteria bacterium]|nr:type II toxin-antitoxin system RelE/ParE family toxin [Pseudomonadota bacterium]